MHSYTLSEVISTNRLQICVGNSVYGLRKARRRATRRFVRLEADVRRKPDMPPSDISRLSTSDKSGQHLHVSFGPRWYSCYFLCRSRHVS